MNNAVHGKTTEKLRKNIDVRLLSNERYYLLWISMQSYVTKNTRK